LVYILHLLDGDRAAGSAAGWERARECGQMARRSRERERSETLNYVQAMLGQLATMAKAERCDMLAYLIEMAYIEASDILRGARPGEERSSVLSHKERNGTS
jgi:Cdc6-like AAA superfamily ATPase